MSPAPDDWGRVRPVLERLLDRAPEERASELERLGRDDPPLARRVAALLDADDHDPAFLEPAPPPTGLGAPAAGDRLGPWRLLRPLGAGGMGEVWLAERADGEFERQVAVKLLRGALPTAGQRGRFERERRLLAALDHPSIARLLDGGTTPAGRPWLAMDLIDGQPIDRAADAAGLSVEQRLRLMIAVCEAVAAAHAALVLHRDLKPDNILVDGSGRPVLLDFGVGTVLSEVAEPGRSPTLTGEQAFTPGYASPEQLLGQPVTTASDVHALGVLLYELLAGRRAHDLTGVRPTEVLRRLTEERPPPPSSVAPPDRARRLRGDLDTIVARAMHPDPARRYASALALAEDLGRHLDGLPVRARPDTLGYRLGRFVTRHAVAVGAAALLLLVLVGSLITITRLYWDSEEARDQADRRSQALAGLARALVFDVADAVEALPGANLARGALLAAVVAALDELDQEEAGPERAQAWLRLGDLAGRPGAASAADLEGAAAAYRRVLALLDQTPDPEAQPLRGEALGKLAAVERRLGESDRARRSLEQAGEAAQDPVAAAALALREAEHWQALGRGDRALTACDQAQALLASQRRADLQVLRLHHLLAWRRGQLLAGRRELEAAEASLRRAVSLAESVATVFPWQVQARRDLALALGELGSLLVQDGRLEPAGPVMERQLELMDGLASDAPQDLSSLGDLALAHEKRAEWRAAGGDQAGALEDRQAALALDRRVAAGASAPSAALGRVGHDLMLVSDGELALGRPQAALEAAREALDLLAPRWAQDRSDVATARDLVVAHLRIGEVLLGQERPDQALPSFERAGGLADELAGTDPDHGPTRRLAMVCAYFQAVSHEALARRPAQDEARRREHLSRALACFRRTLETSRELAGRAMLQPGDAAMDPVVEARIRACEGELAALPP